MYTKGICGKSTHIPPPNHGLKETTMQPVSSKQFDELVASTTKYLQDLMDRVSKLEAAVAEMKKAKKDG